MRKSTTPKVRKPSIYPGPMIAKPQKPVRTPMTKANRKARAAKAQGMSRRGVKGPVQYKAGGGTKKR
jgi:hypothetical protein